MSDFAFSAVEARLFRKAGLLDRERVQSPVSALPNETFRKRTCLPKDSIASLGNLLSGFLATWDGLEFDSLRSAEIAEAIR